jgi:gas vesicle protein
MKFNNFTGFLIGIGVGATTMLLFAPRSGKATRRYLSRRIDDGKDLIERGVDRVQDIGEEIHDKGKETIKQANRAFATAVKAGTSAVSAIL